MAEFRSEQPTATRTARRVYTDCRLIPSQSHCALVIAGPEDEVFAAALQHATGPAHREQDTPELRDFLRRSMRDVPDNDRTLA